MNSDRGQKFTDRNILGKTTISRIIGMNVFINKASGLIAGLQCIYNFS